MQSQIAARGGAEYHAHLEFCTTCLKTSLKSPESQMFAVIETPVDTVAHCSAGLKGELCGTMYYVRGDSQEAEASFSGPAHWAAPKSEGIERLHSEVWMAEILSQTRLATCSLSHSLALFSAAEYAQCLILALSLRHRTEVPTGPWPAFPGHGSASRTA